MKNFFFTTLFLPLFIIQQSFCQDTFSIVAVDTETGEIGAAGATCSDGIGTYGGVQIINKVIPGKGAINSQAFICAGTLANLNYGIDQLMMGNSAKQVLDSLMINDKCNAGGTNNNPEYRQYGILSVDSAGSINTIGFTGEEASDFKGHRIGDNYVITGNNLTSTAVLDSMETYFNATNTSLAAKLLAAMEGGKLAGGDARCADRNTSSTSAFLRVSKPDDEFLLPYIYLSIPSVPQGAEPIDSLQVLYQDLLLSSPLNEAYFPGQFTIINEPFSEMVKFEVETEKFETISVFISDINGKMLSNSILNTNQLYELPVKNYPSGLYLLTVKTSNGFATKRFHIIQ